MKTDKPTYEQLEERLAQAEAILRTLQKGQADAVVCGRTVHLLRRQETEEAIRRAQEELEQRIERRNSELLDANLALEQEIAEHQRVGEELRLSHERYRTVFESLLDGVCLLEPIEDGRDFVITNINPAGLAINEHRSPEEVIGIPLLELYPGIAAFGLHQALQHCWRTGEPVHHPIAFYQDHRTSGWRENHISKLSTGELVVVFKDLTIRKRAEENLLRGEARYRRLFDSTPIANWELELSGLARRLERVRRAAHGQELRSWLERHPHRLAWCLAGVRVTEVNSRAIQVFEAERREQLLGRLPSPFLVETPEILAAPLAMIAAGEGLVGLETAIRTLRGNRREVEIRISVSCDSEGRPEQAVATVLDVTERRRMEHELRRQGELLALSQKIARLGSWELDLRTGQVAWSRETCTIMGLDPSRPASRELFYSLIHPADRRRVQETLERAFALHSSFSVEFQVERPQGEIRHVLSRGELEFDDKGAAIRVLGTAQDITEQKRLEVELRRREQHLAQAQRLAQMGSWLWEIPSGALHWSEGVYHIIGRRPDEIEPTYPNFLDQVVHPEDRRKVVEAVDRALRERGAYDVYHRMLRPDGELRILHEHGEVELGPDGSLLRMLGTVQDVTEQIRAEEELRHSEQRLRQAQQIARVGNWEWDVLNDRVEWSEITYEIFGRPPGSTVTTADAFDGVHPEDREPLRRQVLATAEQGIPLVTEFRLVRPDGEVRYVADRGEGFRDESGRLVRIFGTVQDITERKRMEEELRRRGELLAKAQQLAHVGSFEWDLRTGENIWSEETYRIFEVEPGTPPHIRMIRERYHPDDLWMQDRELEASLLERRDYEVTHRIVTPAGKVKVIKARGAYGYDEEGRAIRLHGAVQDITEQVRAEEELRRREQMLIESQRIAQLGSWEWWPQEDGSWKIEWSQEMFEIYELPIGTPMTRELARSMRHPEELEQVSAQFDEILEKEDRYAFQQRIITTRGREKVLLVRGECLRDQSGKLLVMRGTSQDVTEQVRMEQELRRSEQLLSEAQQIAHLGSWELNIETGAIRWSQQMYEFYGITPGTPITLDLLRRHRHPEEAKLVEERLEQAIREKSGFDSQQRIIAVDGTERIILSRGELVEDEHGRKVILRGTSLDITELKHTEYNLKQAQQIGRMGSWELDLRTNTVIWSEMVYRLYGLEPDGRPIELETVFARIHPEDSPKLREEIRRAVSERRGYLVEYRLIQPGGTELVLQTLGKPEFDNQGQPIAMRGVVQDITERRRMEEALLAERERLQRLLEHRTLLAEIAGTINSAGSFREVLDGLLERIMQVFDAPSACFFAFADEDRKTLELIERRVQEGRCCSGVNRLEAAKSPDFFKRLEESVVFCTTELLEQFCAGNCGARDHLICPVVVDGWVGGFLALTSDRKDQHDEELYRVLNTIGDLLGAAWQRDRQAALRLEAERRQGEANRMLEQSARLASIGVLAGGITHEINQPLNAIGLITRGMIAGIESGWQNEPKVLIGDLQEVVRQLDRIDQTITQMRLFWVAPERAPEESFDLSAAVLQAMNLVEKHLLSSDIRLELRLSGDRLPVRGRHIHLEQIVINLVMNSMYALEEIQRESKLILVTTLAVDRRAVLEVTDNGPGLPEGTGEKIFDPFFSTRKPGQGTGLGLAIVRKFVQEYGGQINPSKNEWGGATMTVEFPLEGNT